MRSKIDFAALRERTTTLDDDQAAIVQARVFARHTRHVARTRAARFGSGALLAAVCAVVLVVALNRRREASVATMPAAPSSSFRILMATQKDAFGGIVLSDGSRVAFLAPGTELVQSGVHGRQTTLVHGAARFDVVHDTSATFRVTAGSVVVEDVGTVFTVRIGEDGATIVGVESGAVSVRGSHGERTLEAGASQTFPVAPSVEAPAPSARVSNPPPAPTPPSSWKKLAHAGEFARAFASMQDEKTPLRDDPEELLLAADAARFSGHATDAAPILSRLVDKFPSDSRAGLAAFTLGRVLLDDLGRPEEAARAFATAYARGGPLAEDALAREAEAYARAGNRSAAKNAAARYVSTYPGGSRSVSMRKIADGP